MREGEFVAVTGPSGSGKTTFLNIAGLLEDFTGGEYLLDGVDVRGLDDNARSRLRNEKIGFIFQGFNLIPDLNLFDNVDVPLRYRGFDAAERKQRIEEALGRVGLASRMKHYPAELSGGQQQRVGDRARAGRRAAPAARRRADRQPRLADGARRDGAAGGDQRAGHHHRDGHPRPGTGRARAAQRPHHRRPGRPTSTTRRAWRARRRAAAVAERRLRSTAMFAYYFELALRSFRRNPMLTALMVLAIALGIGASMTTLTVLHVMSGDPIPHKSDRLFDPQLDPRHAATATPRATSPPDQMTYHDARSLLRERQARDRQAVMTGGGSAIAAASAQDLQPFMVEARYTSRATSSRCSRCRSCTAAAGARPRTTRARASW